MIHLGVFDSGIGGLTVYRTLRERVPCASILYLGDTARVPYGTKSADTVTRYSLQISRHLVDRGVDAIVVACNTASAFSLKALQEAMAVPVFGVVEPGARAAVKATRSGVVGVVGTRATVSSGAYERAIAAVDDGVKVTAVPCPLFVPLVEEGWLSEEVTFAVAGRYLGGLVDQGVDTLVLGCTHYPLLKGVIGEVMGHGVTLIDSAEETAAEVRDHLECEGLISDDRDVQDLFEVTDSPSRFADVARIFLDRQLTDVNQVILEGE